MNVQKYIIFGIIIKKNQYEAIINYGIPLGKSKIGQYSGYHIGKLMEEIQVIMKANFTEYHQAEIKSLNNHYISCFNVFIMKKFIMKKRFY